MHRWSASGGPVTWTDTAMLSTFIAIMLGFVLWSWRTLRKSRRQYMRFLYRVHVGRRYVEHTSYFEVESTVRTLIAGNSSLQKQPDPEEGQSRTPVRSSAQLPHR